ncbi:hypothetical protein F0L74_00275 [Chitinophaga agrisoli]|uniref:YD repeat-containing protein n=1 Tax=Chitinophaga agrisoli TaxID=2607653 RepID=A0A5B2W040_9BACT|nr:hypothetical protein [Chitinophaga agrisoli]KAA2244454.1 hypothetical protein F0L74_00275 [Chitinophaga agrisoli]
MKQLFANCSVCFVVYSFFLLTTACKKTDHWNKPCCFEGPACNAQTMMVAPRDCTYTGGAYSKPYKFTKTYGPDGRVNYLDGYEGPFWGGPFFTGTVHYQRKRVYMLDVNSRDTIMTADLNDCGQPVRARATYNTPWTDSSAWLYVFLYDQKGRLSQLQRDNQSNPFNPIIYTYEYDRYDNIIRIADITFHAEEIRYIYDYSRPIKGGYYDSGSGSGMGDHIWEILGDLHTQPHHIMTKIISTGVGNGAWAYENQVVNADGYLVYYEANIYDYIGGGIKVTLLWNCGKSHSHNAPGKS